MKAFIAGVVAALVIAIGSAVILQSMDQGADMAYSTTAARVTPDAH